MDGIPNGSVIDVVITMSKNIPHAAKSYPVWAWTEEFGIAT